MANITHFSGSQGTLFAPLTNWVNSVREKLALRRNYNRTLNELSSLSRHQLADLGLHRSTLRQAAYQATYHRIG